MNADNRLVSIIERRAKKAFLNSGIPRNARIAVLNDGSCEGEVNACLAKKLAGAATVREIKRVPLRNAYDFVALPDTADRIAAELLDFMLNSKDVKVPGRAVRLLKGSLSSEVASYARIKRIKYAKKEKSLSDAALLIEKLEKSCKGRAFALAKASHHLKWQKQARQQK